MNKLYPSDIEALRQQLAEAHAETDSAVYARDEAYRMLAECERERDMLVEALKERLKQIGVACLKHDLIHSLVCGVCHSELKGQRDELVEACAEWKALALGSDEALAKVERREAGQVGAGRGR
jgi:hypothetical protein